MGTSTGTELNVRLLKNKYYMMVVHSTCHFRQKIYETTKMFHFSRRDMSQEFTLAQVNSCLFTDSTDRSQRNSNLSHILPEYVAAMSHSASQKKFLSSSHLMDKNPHFTENLDSTRTYHNEIMSVARFLF